MPKLFALHQQNPDMKISISAEMMAMHGDVISVLDKVRTAGFKKVGFQIRAAQTQGSQSTVPAGQPPPPPPPKP
jgi:biopolymer transport protein ExbD